MKPLLGLGASAMSCAKCGCRMVTKVGSTNTMLICSDCGHPRVDKALPRHTRLKRLATAGLLAALAGLAFAVSRISDRTPPRDAPVGTSQAG